MLDEGSLEVWIAVVGWLAWGSGGGVGGIGGHGGSHVMTARSYESIGSLGVGSRGLDEGDVQDCS